MGQESSCATVRNPSRCQRAPSQVGPVCAGRSELRHTYAAHLLAALVPTYTLAQIMGTSVAQIDATYGHLLPSSGDLVRRRANEYLRELRAVETATGEVRHGS